MTRDFELPAKVKAVNRANAEAVLLHKVLTDYFRPYVGKKVVTVNGDLLAKIEKNLPMFPRSGLSVEGLHVYRHRSNYSLAWMVKTCEHVGEHTCLYHETGVTVGNLDGDILKDVTPVYGPTKTDYDVETVRALRKTAREAEKAYNNARDACYPFGEG